MSARRKIVADVAFLLALMTYILAGVTLVPPHGDEYMQMSMARDTFYAANGQGERLASQPPLQPDTEPYLRVINGTINKWLIGLLWLGSGRTEVALPDIYAWGMTHQWNITDGRVPTDDALHLARLPSAVLTALGVLPLFWLGWQLRRRSVAYPAVVIYALHPAILLNGRRAMMEGGLLCLTLLLLAWAVAMIRANHTAPASSATQGIVARLPSSLRWALLGMGCGLAMSAKHTAILVVIAAPVGVVIATLIRRRTLTVIAYQVVSVVIAALCALLSFAALNPGYWRDPLGAVQAVIAARAELLSRQTTDPSLAYASGGQRLEALVIQPFLRRLQYFEAPTWAGLIDTQVAAYERTSLDGLVAGEGVGGVIISLLLWALTVLAMVGVVALAWEALHNNLLTMPILLWSGLTLLGSVSIPLDWGRYYLPLTLVSIVAAAYALGRVLVRRDAAESAVP
jgi:4-amino-4-deoxy-L-arabinose transferase-like glycosyltransferase